MTEDEKPAPPARQVFSLPAHVCIKVDVDDRVKIVPIGQRVPHVLKMYLTWVALVNIGTDFFKAILTHEKTSEFVFHISVPVYLLRPEEMPYINDREGNLSPIVGVDGSQMPAAKP